MTAPILLEALLIVASQLLHAAAPTPEEMAATREWMAALGVRAPGVRPLGSAKPPFSFVYGGQPSADLLPTWECKATDRKLDEQRTEHTLLLTDPKTALALRCVTVEYRDFPAVEWTLFFRNAGQADSPILEKILSLDARIQRGPAGEFVLHHSRGDSCTPNSYEPLTTVLGPKSEHRFAPAGGRPTNGAWPCFNIEHDGQGAILAIAWPGQWAATFGRDEAAGLHIRAGQELTRFKLLPGEEVRSPLTVLLVYKGDWLRGQNLWRRWMLAHNTPHPGGKPPAPLFASCSGGFMPGLKCDEATEFRFIDTYTTEGVKLDYWWMDAGWYPCGDGWPNVGTWEPDPQRFPRGIRAVSDHAHAKGIKTILWFEPERVTPGTWLYTNHPEWLLGGGGTKLLNLGNPEARKWLTDHVDKLLTEQGIDLYRQDFNMDPLGYWRAADAPDRQGITEIRHVEGYLAYWDELRRRHPDMLIDSCASGGRRNDLETLRRAVPLLRSDYQSFAGDPGYAPGNQGHTYGLSLWLPYYGQGTYYNDNQLVYAVRSHFCPAFGFCWDVRKPGVDWAKFRRLVEDWRKIADCLLGDYYPLTPYTLASDAWIAWQFDRPDLGRGAVQAFRRADSPYVSARLKLRGLDPDARYTLANLDTSGATEATGRELCEKGLPISIVEKPGSAILTYERAK